MDEKAVRIDKWLAMKFPEFSRSQITTAIREGNITAGNTINLKPKDILPPGTEIIVRLINNDSFEFEPHPQTMPLDIIYEDQDLIVLNKPINLVVHPGAANSDRTLVNGLLEYTKGNLSDINGKQRRGIIHRLDKDTSGLILIAKNNKFHQAMQDLFKKRKIQRIYRALVWNVPKSPKGTIDAPIGRDPFSRTKMAVIPDGKSGLTYFSLLSEFNYGINHTPASELEVELYTGRTHQIRVHLAYINLPIIGDPLYNLGRDKFDLPAQALFAAKLKFEHPISFEKLKFEIEAPAYYKQAVMRLSNQL